MAAAGIEASPPRDKAPMLVDDGFQVGLECGHHHQWDRVDTSDPETPILIRARDVAEVNGRSISCKHRGLYRRFLLAPQGVRPEVRVLPGTIRSVSAPLTRIRRIPFALVSACSIFNFLFPVVIRRTLLIHRGSLPYVTRRLGPRILRWTRVVPACAAERVEMVGIRV